MIDGLVMVKDLIMSVNEDLAVSGKEFGDSRSFSLHFDVDVGSADREETYCAKLGASSVQGQSYTNARFQQNLLRLCIVSLALHPCSLALPVLSKMADAFVLKRLGCFGLPYIRFGFKCRRCCVDYESLYMFHN
ncbi:hypothetical protein SASPL_138885 [Salvia splendens]|uniref:Uncharacterized protein n=1 Tax=Salvia splendens TaxID=180675 RepID=A0A8X8VX80_SALSN|nr:hypothetical protein SASPL_156138 [Salvia splendens]KAG6402016.1 hypothetical protein SASPL_138885 [Salvia splendens]